jgi:hypothetical protein
MYLFSVQKNALYMAIVLDFVLMKPQVRPVNMALSGILTACLPYTVVLCHQTLNKYAPQLEHIFNMKT